MHLYGRTLTHIGCMRAHSSKCSVVCMPLCQATISVTGKTCQVTDTPTAPALLVHLASHTQPACLSATWLPHRPTNKVALGSSRSSSRSLSLACFCQQNSLAWPWPAVCHWMPPIPLSWPSPGFPCCCPSRLSFSLHDCMESHLD